MNRDIAVQNFFARQQSQSNAIMQYLRGGVWLYFFLLIFEGALRKWFLPFLSTPLLIVRDPIALWVVIVSWQRGFLKNNLYIEGILIVSIISFVATLLVGHGDIFVALFGLRITLIHFPFMFAIGALFNAEDIERLGRITLWISLPMVVLIAIQFYSPQSAWVNRGTGGDEGGAGFTGALGYFRPPGTFSFTNGNALFFGFASTFVCYYLLNSDRINRLLLIGSCISILAAVPLSISRGLSFTVAIVVFFMLTALTRKPQYTGRVVIGIIGVVLLFIILNQFVFFQTASEAFTTRFTSANELEGGLVEGVIGDRYFGGMLGAITNSSQLPFFGYGMGMGTNVGSQLLTGEINFLISEGEWGRLIGEMGLLLGLLAIIIRMGFCLHITIVSYKQLAQNNILPWMMLSFALLAIPQGQWAQPTSLGFSTLAGGLVLASLNRKRDDTTFISRK